MRKLVIVGTVVLALVWWQNRPRSGALDHFGRRLALPFRVLRLGMEPPDEIITMPVEGARVKKVTNTWNAPRPGGRVHEGQDIFAPRGTPLYSATRGVVVRVGSNTLGGKSVFVAGPGGRTYYYAHLDRYAEDLRTGDVVDRSSVLGYVGNTGNARGTPPHLHLGIYAAGGAMDPLPLLADRGASVTPAAAGM